MEEDGRSPQRPEDHSGFSHGISQGNIFVEVGSQGDQRIQRTEQDQPKLQGGQRPIVQPGRQLRADQADAERPNEIPAAAQAQMERT